MNPNNPKIGGWMIAAIGYESHSQFITTRVSNMHHVWNALLAWVLNEPCLRNWEKGTSKSNLKLPVKGWVQAACLVKTQQPMAEPCGGNSLSLRGTPPTMYSGNTISFTYFHKLYKSWPPIHIPWQPIEIITNLQYSLLS